MHKMNINKQNNINGKIKIHTLENVPEVNSIEWYWNRPKEECVISFCAH